MHNKYPRKNTVNYHNFKTTNTKNIFALSKKAHNILWANVMWVECLEGKGKFEFSKMQNEKEGNNRGTNDMKNEYKSNIFMRVLIPNVYVHSYEICGIEMYMYEFFFSFFQICYLPCIFLRLPFFFSFIRSSRWPHKYKLHSHVHIMIPNCCAVK